MDPKRLIESLLSTAYEATGLKPQWLVKHAGLMQGGMGALSRLLDYLYSCLRRGLGKNAVLLPLLNDIDGSLQEALRLVRVCGMGKSALYSTIFAPALAAEYVNVAGTLHDCCHTLVDLLRTTDVGSAADVTAPPPGTFKGVEDEASRLDSMIADVENAFDPAKYTDLLLASVSIREELVAFLAAQTVVASTPRLVLPSTKVSKGVQAAVKEFSTLVGALGLKSVAEFHRELILWEEYQQWVEEHHYLQRQAEQQRMLLLLQGVETSIERKRREVAESRRRQDAYVMARTKALLQFVVLGPGKVSETTMQLLQGVVLSAAASPVLGGMVESTSAGVSLSTPPSRVATTPESDCSTSPTPGMIPGCMLPPPAIGLRPQIIRACLPLSASTKRGEDRMHPGAFTRFSLHSGTHTPAPGDGKRLEDTSIPVETHVGFIPRAATAPTAPTAPSVAASTQKTAGLPSRMAFSSRLNHQVARRDLKFAMAMAPVPQQNAGKQERQTVPPEFKCPLSLQLMVDPVIIASGHSFERSFIEAWFGLGRTVCPASEQPLEHLALIPNITLKATIASWCVQQGAPVPTVPPTPKRLRPQAMRFLQSAPSSPAGPILPLLQPAVNPLPTTSGRNWRSPECGGRCFVPAQLVPPKEPQVGLQQVSGCSSDTSSLHSHQVLEQQAATPGEVSAAGECPQGSGQPGPGREIGQADVLLLHTAGVSASSTPEAGEDCVAPMGGLRGGGLSGASPELLRAVDSCGSIHNQMGLEELVSVTAGCDSPSSADSQGRPVRELGSSSSSAGAKDVGSCALSESATSSDSVAWAADDENEEERLVGAGMRQGLPADLPGELVELLPRDTIRRQGSEPHVGASSVAARERSRSMVSEAGLSNSSLPQGVEVDAADPRKLGSGSPDSVLEAMQSTMSLGPDNHDGAAAEISGEVQNQLEAAAPSSEEQREEAVEKTEAGVGNSMPRSRTATSGSRIRWSQTITDLQLADQTPTNQVGASGKDRVPAASTMQKGQLKAVRSDSWHAGNGSAEARLLVWGLKSGVVEERKKAAQQIRRMAKSDDGARRQLADAGAVQPLLGMLREGDISIVDAALYALLNLSIDEEVKWQLTGHHIIQLLLHLSRSASGSIQEASVALLFSLSATDENKHLIGSHGGIPFLQDILINGSDCAKQDALLALYNLSLLSSNKAILLRQRVVPPLVRLVSFAPAHKFSESAIGLLRNLVTREEGRDAVVAERGIPALARALEWGSVKGKEEAASVLLVISSHNPAHRHLIWESGVGPALRTLARCGTDRARAKAEALVQALKEHSATLK